MKRVVVKQIQLHIHYCINMDICTIITFSRVCINRVGLAILLVVS